MRPRVIAVAVMVVCLALDAAAAATEAVYSCNPSPPAPLFVADQSGDPAYCPRLAHPAHAFAQGPAVLFDEGHHNWGRISPSPLTPSAGTYFALGELLRADGYRVTVSRGKLTADLLRGEQLLIIVQPLPAEWFLASDDGTRAVPNPAAYSGAQAFDADEIAALSQWISAGGSLLLNGEHTPYLESNVALLAALGLRTPANVYDTTSAQPYIIAAPSHPIFTGRLAGEAVTSLPPLANVGGGVDLIGAGTALTRFGSWSLGLTFATTTTLRGALANLNFYTFCSQPDGDPAALSPTCQALQQAGQLAYFLAGQVSTMKALELGRGRAVVFSEFSTLSCLFDRTGSTSVPYGGLTDPAYTQLILNVLHWLAP